MYPQDLEDKMRKFANQAAKYGEEWAVKQGIYNSVSDRKNDLLAKLTNDAVGTTNAEKERNARCSEEWIDFRCDLGKMQCEALNLKIKYETAVRNFECARSLLSSKNAERRTS